MQERITPRSADNASAGPSLPEATDGLQFEAITGPAAKREQAAMLSDRLARIADLETRQAALAAEQVQLTAEFLAERERFEAAWHPGFGRQAARIIAAEMATAKRVSVWSAERFCHDAKLLVESLPQVLNLLATGQISAQTARTVAYEAHDVDSALLPLLDGIVAEELPGVPPSRVGSLLRRRVIEIDPDAAARRAKRAREERRVEARADLEPGQGVLTARLPTEQVAACWHALDGHARGVRADGDPRSVSQIMADTLVERVTGQVAADAVTAHVNVVMTDLTLFGASNRPAEIVGFGPVPAPIGRLLATTKSAWLRRFFTDPRDDSVATCDTRRRRFDGTLRELVLAVDQHCQGIACAAPIVDVDHQRDHSDGGPTDAAHGRGGCQRCHHSKDHPGMTTPMHPDAARTLALTRWRTPIGLVVDNLAPPALGYGSSTLAQLRHRNRLRSKHGFAGGDSRLEQHLHAFLRAA